MPAEIGQPAPAFDLPSQDREPVTLDSLKGRNSLVVFIPFPFTGICTAEACMLRDSLNHLGDIDANVVIITTHSLFTNKKWADEHELNFPVLADYWPHGEVSIAYGNFNADVGVANRSTYVLDADGIVRDIIETESLGIQREHSAYVEALAKL